jgi:multiple sugar transport system permease protein
VSRVDSHVGGQGVRPTYKRGRLRRWWSSDAPWAHLLLLPTYIGLFGLVLGPVVAGFVISFFRWDLITPPVFIGLDNYQALADDRLFWKALRNTTYYVVGSIPPAVTLSLLLALALNQSIRGRAIFRTTFFLPVVSSTVAVAVLWGWMFNTQIGLVNHVLGLVGISRIPWITSETWAMPAVIIMSVWKSLGYNMILFLAGLQGIPREYYEAAEIDGAGTIRRFWNITLPLLSPTMFLVVILSVITSFQVFEQTYVLTGGGPANSTLTLVLMIFYRGFQDFRMGYASSIAYVLFSIVFVITLVQWRLQKRWVHYGH